MFTGYYKKPKSKCRMRCSRLKVVYSKDNRSVKLQNYYSNLRVGISGTGVTPYTTSFNCKCQKFQDLGENCPTSAVCNTSINRFFTNGCN